MTAWLLLIAYLRGRAPAPLPALPGRVIRAADMPLPDDELRQVTDPKELARLEGISHAKAVALIEQWRAEAAAGAAATPASESSSAGPVPASTPAEPGLEVPLTVPPKGR